MHDDPVTDPAEGAAGSEAERLLRAAAEASRVVIFRRGQGVEWSSPAIEEVVGLPPEDLVGARLKELVHPDDLAGGIPDPERLLAGETVTVRLRVLHRDGRPRWIAARLRSRDGVDPAEGGEVVVNWRPIDEEVAATAGLAESERRLRLVAEASRDAIVLTHGRVVAWASPAIEEIVGIPPDQVVGRQLAEMGHPDDVGRLDAARERLARGELVTVRFRVRHVDGSWHWVSVRARPLLDEAGAPTGEAVANWRLVDDSVAAAEELARSRQALEESERLLRLVVENTRDVITLTDHGTLEWVSPVVADLLGQPPDQLFGADFAGLVHPDDLVVLDAGRARVVARGGAPAAGRLRLRHADGSWHWFEARSRMLVGPDGEPDGRVVTSWRLVDDEVAYLEALHRSEESNRELAGQLQQALDSRVVIEQAKGILAGERGISVDAAFAMLRDHARRRGAPLREVAEAVVNLGLRP